MANIYSKAVGLILLAMTGQTDAAPLPAKFWPGGSRHPSVYLFKPGDKLIVKVGLYKGWELRIVDILPKHYGYGKAYRTVIPKLDREVIYIYTEQELKGVKP